MKYPNRYSFICSRHLSGIGLLPQGAASPRRNAGQRRDRGHSHAPERLPRSHTRCRTPKHIPPHWWGPFAVWDGGLGIWGGVALAAGVRRLRRQGAGVPVFMDAVAPALLVAQGIGRIGNYFNPELFGGPTSLPRT